MRTLTLITLGACACAALPALAGDWSDTNLGYRHGTKFQETSTNQDITKDIISLSHVSGYKYGKNFFNIDVLKSASGVNSSTDFFQTSRNSKVYDNINGTTDGTGAQELYLVYMHTLSFGKVFGKDIRLGPMNDIGLVTGFDFNSKNTAFAPKTEKWYIGPSISFDVSNGYLDLRFLYLKERNNNSSINQYFDTNNFNAYSTGRSVSFDGTWRVGIAGSKAFSMGPIDSNFKGWVNYTGKKGKDGFGRDTEAETQGELAWMFDIGKAMGHKGSFYIGPGYAYWNNKFGVKNVDDPNLSPFAQNRRTSALQLELEIHF